ncbi:TPA: Qnr family pentapeptide repeat protein, partial [Vibrio parahaemolyticus]|nr:Qnr family pentapeptide repeat protein [Vibrio parahaemolyticus]
RFANLKDASFTNCMLAMSLFNGANCMGLELRKCDLKGANFQGANFANRVSNTMFFCSAFITGCNLTYCNFERVLLEKCDLFENRWNGANLAGATLKGSDLSRCEFSPEQWGTFNVEQCDLTHVELDGLDVRRVSLFGVKICDWQQEQLLAPFGLIIL